MYINSSSIQGLNFIYTPDARFVYKRLISDARIQKSYKKSQINVSLTFQTNNNSLKKNKTSEADTETAKIHKNRYDHNPMQLKSRIPN